MTVTNEKAKLSLTVVKMTKRGYILFFEDSILSFILEKDFVKKSKKELKKKFKAEKVSVLKRSQAIDMFWDEYGNQYLEKTKTEVLSEITDIQEFEYKSIEKFKLTPFRRNVKVGGSDSTPQDYLGEISIKSASDKLWFNHKYMADDTKYAEAKAIKEKIGV